MELLPEQSICQKKILAVFFSPIAEIFNSSITAPALIMVGIYLLLDIKRIHFDSMDETIPALLTVAMMPMAYSITAGIATGFISYVICKFAAKKTKEIGIPSYVLCLIFILYFVIS